MSESRARGAAFDRFWAAYPRKVGKQDAARAFARVKAPVEQLIAAVEAQMQSQQWQREGGRYIPNPATWLNQGRWEDSLPAAQQDYGRAGEGFQHHGQAISPMMREAAQRLMDEEAAEAAEDTGGQRADVGIGPYGDGGQGPDGGRSVSGRYGEAGAQLADVGSGPYGEGGITKW